MIAASWRACRRVIAARPRRVRALVVERSSSGKPRPRRSSAVRWNATNSSLVLRRLRDQQRRRLGLRRRQLRVAGRAHDRREADRRPGRSIAIAWPIMPPIDAPTRAPARCRARRETERSAAMSSACTATFGPKPNAAFASSSSGFGTPSASNHVERPMSRLSKRITRKPRREQLARNPGPAEHLRAEAHDQEQRRPTDRRSSGSRGRFRWPGRSTSARRERGRRARPGAPSRARGTGYRQDRTSGVGGGCAPADATRRRIVTPAAALARCPPNRWARRTRARPTGMRPGRRSSSAAR